MYRSQKHPQIKSYKWTLCERRSVQQFIVLPWLKNHRTLQLLSKTMWIKERSHLWTEQRIIRPMLPQRRLYSWHWLQPQDEEMQTRHINQAHRLCHWHESSWWSVWKSIKYHLKLILDIEIWLFMIDRSFNGKNINWAIYFTHIN